MGSRACPQLGLGSQVSTATRLLSLGSLTRHLPVCPSIHRPLVPHFSEICSMHLWAGDRGAEVPGLGPHTQELGAQQRLWELDLSWFCMRRLGGACHLPDRQRLTVAGSLGVVFLPLEKETSLVKSSVHTLHTPGWGEGCLGLCHQPCSMCEPEIWGQNLWLVVVLIELYFCCPSRALEISLPFGTSPAVISWGPCPSGQPPSLSTL